MGFQMQPYGIQSMLKEGHKHLSGLDEAVLKNIDACKQLSTITRTSLGPNGMYAITLSVHFLSFFFWFYFILFFVQLGDPDVKNIGPQWKYMIAVMIYLVLHKTMVFVIVIFICQMQL